jgi:hypothetical protein
MNCSDVQNKLIFYSEGSLNPYEWETIHAHISTCAECKLLSVKLDQSISIIENQKKAEVKPYLYTRVDTKINKIDQHTRTVYRRVLQPIIVTGIVVIALFAGILFGEAYPSDTNTTATTSISSESYYWNDAKEETVELALLNE